jgi:hypothetical protein
VHKRNTVWVMVLQAMDVQDGTGMMGGRAFAVRCFERDRKALWKSGERCSGFSDFEGSWESKGRGQGDVDRMR